MNWIEESKNIFDCLKPENFGNFNHCEECFEYNEHLKSKNVASIQQEDLEPDDPLCFCSDEGIKYFIPALIRISLYTDDDNFYFSYLLNHLEKDGKDNSLYMSCNTQQRLFIRDFIDYMINTYPDTLENYMCDHQAFRTYEIWEKA